ncbi:MAG: anti-sigma factor [Gaiellaceae bacterium]
MSDTPDFRDLVGDDLTPEEELELSRVDRLLRSVPRPATDVPGSLTSAVERIGTSTPLWTRRRATAVAALAAALAALFFGVGRWTDNGFDARATVRMNAADIAPQASAVIKLGARDEATGNWKLRLEVDGLPALGGNGYYVLWLAKDGKYAGTCGTFNVNGPTTIDMTASYRLSEYDAWVISEARDNAPWLLSAKI